MANVTVYVMTIWRNLPNKTSSIDELNLNHIEQGIKNVTDFVNTINAGSGLYLSQTPFTTALKNKLDGIEAQANKYVLPTASNSTLGGVKVDAETITIDQNGVIHAAAAATQLSALTDVNLEDLADGQILKYDADTGKWVNTSEAEVRTQLSLLEDVDIDYETLENGQTLRYNSTTEKWENGEGGDVLGYDETLQALGDPAQNVPSIPIVYSFDEQVIGKWVDGKPLYQKTIDLGENVTISNTEWTIITNDLNNDIVENIIMAYATNDTGTFAPLMATTFLSSQPTVKAIFGLATRDNSVVTIRYFTLRYTKITDTAPSS